MQEVTDQIRKNLNIPPVKVKYVIENMVVVKVSENLPTIFAIQKRIKYFVKLVSHGQD